MKKLKEFKTLLIDGESLLKTGFFGRKDLQNENFGVGAIFHFIYTLKKLIDNFGYNKVVVCWDHPNSGWFRIQYYPMYKWNRNEASLSEFEQFSLSYQRVRIKQYLEELFIRQIEEKKCEADDLIAYYVKNTSKENKTVYTADTDLLQLLDKNTDIYLTGKKLFINRENFHEIFGYNHKNVLLMKILEGDKTDDIEGIKNLGQKTILKKFPELIKNKKTFDFIKTRCDQILQEKQDKVAENILNGRTKIGDFGDNYFYTMDKLINLNHEMLTEEAKKNLNRIIDSPLNPEGRSEENAIKMMTEDEILSLLPQSENGFYKFIQPFIKIKNKETEKFKKERKWVTER